MHDKQLPPTPNAPRHLAHLLADAANSSPIQRVRHDGVLRAMDDEAKELARVASKLGDSNRVDEEPRCLLTNAVLPDYCHVVPRATEEPLVRTRLGYLTTMI